MTPCPECSKENNEDANFCQYCGTEIAHPEKETLSEDDHVGSNLNKGLNLESRSIRDLIVSILVLLDTVLIGFILLYPSYSNSVYILGFDLAVCIILVIEFIQNKKSENYESTFKEDVVDIFAMIPLWFFVLLPAAWTNYLAFMRLFRILILLEKGKKNIFNFIQKTHLSYIILTLFIIICAGSIAVLVVEESSHGDINTPLDAVWYVISTVTTVGYGDVTPDSFGGKVIGIILMIVGVGFFSLLTAHLSSLLMKRHEEEEDEVRHKIIGMEKSIDEIKSEMKELNEILKENK